MNDLWPFGKSRLHRQRRRPTYGRCLPFVMGAGGWSVEEPTLQDLDNFLRLLDKVPLEYFGSAGRTHPEYGERFTSVINVEQWLRLLVDEKLLAVERQRSAA